MRRHDHKSPVWFRLVPIIVMLLVPCAAIGDREAGEGESGAILGRVFLDENADTFLKECDCDCGLEAIPIRLYKERCAGLIIQTARTNSDGYFHFKGLEPGEYCVMPDIKMICEGFQPTKPITQRVQVKAGEDTEVEWFAFDHWLDIND
jgi:hypothetical protein